jgi:hypothetical protein
MSAQYDPYKNFKFRVVVEGVTAGAFKNVEGLDSETEVVEYRSGAPKSLRWRTVVGVHDGAALDRASRLGRPGAVLLKGFIPLSPLQRLLQSGQGQHAGTHMKRGIILQTTASGKVITQWEFTHAWPSKWKGPAPKGGNPVSPDKILLVFQKVWLSSPVSSSRR